MNIGGYIFLAMIIGIPLLYAFPLRFLWWLEFGRRGRRALFVYSDNPKFAELVEKYVVPRLTEQVLAVNASALAHWPTSLPGRIHSHWTESKDHTPVAIVFTSFWRVKSVRLYRPFLKAIHGNTITLDRCLAELQRLLREAGGSP